MGDQTNLNAPSSDTSEVDLKRVAFKMKLLPGKEEEYKMRHNDIWPELEMLLKDAGISLYSIFLDRDTGSLFGILNIKSTADIAALAQQEIMQRWWHYMSDIMESNPDHSPVTTPLEEVFYLP